MASTNIFIGLNIENVGKFRINYRESKVQYYDKVAAGNNNFLDVYWCNVPNNYLSQRVDTLKNISQLSFKYGRFVFEIEIPVGMPNQITILMTNVETYESRLIDASEYMADNGLNWNGLFLDNGELAGAGMLQVSYGDIPMLCSLAKDIINLAAVYYVRQGYADGELANELSDVVKLVMRNNNYLATIRNDHYVWQDIINWFAAGRPTI